MSGFIMGALVGTMVAAFFAAAITQLLGLTSVAAILLGVLLGPLGSIAGARLLSEYFE